MPVASQPCISAQAVTVSIKPPRALSQSLEALILPVSLAQSSVVLAGLDVLRVRLLQSFSARFAAINLFGAAGLFFLLLPHSLTPAFVAWLLAFLLPLATLAYQARPAAARIAGATSSEVALHFEDQRVLLLGVMGVLWGLPGFIFPLGSTPWALAIPLAVVAVCVCSVPLLSASRKAFGAFALPMLLIEAISLVALSPVSVRSDPRLYFLVLTGLAVVLGIFHGASVGTIRALVRRNKYEQALVGQASVLENGLVGIVALRDEWVIRANSYFLQLLGFDRAAMEAKSIRQLLAGPDDLRLLHELMREIHAPSAGTTAPPARSRELQLRRLDGDQIWCSVQAQSATDEQGRPSTLLFIADISRRKHIENRLFDSERAYRNLVDSCPSMIFATDRESNFVFVSEHGAQQVLGMSAAELEGRQLSEMFAAADAKQTRMRFAPLWKGTPIRDLVCEIHTPQGRQVYLSITISPMRDPRERIIGFQGAATDVTERIRAQQALARARDHVRDAVESIPGPMALLDAEERVQACNQAFLDQFAKTGYATPIGITFENLLIGWVARGNPTPAEFGRDGKRWIATRLKALRDLKADIIAASDGRWLKRDVHATPTGGRVILDTDISEWKKSEAQADRNANFDMLTGLANRRLLDDRIERAIVQLRRLQQRAAIVMIDLDHFKPVNDQRGHAIGDAVLVEVAGRLTATLRETDTVARYGGDEFVAVITALKSDEDALTASAKLLAALLPPIKVGEHTIEIGASLGVAIAIRHGADSATLLRRADAAMFRAKSLGRNRVVMCELDALGKTLSLPTIPALEPVISGEFPVYRPVSEHMQAPK